MMHFSRLKKDISGTGIAAKSWIPAPISRPIPFPGLDLVAATAELSGCLPRSVIGFGNRLICPGFDSAAVAKTPASQNTSAAPAVCVKDQ